MIANEVRPELPNTLTPFWLKPDIYINIYTYVYTHLNISVPNGLALAGSGGLASLVGQPGYWLAGSGRLAQPAPVSLVPDSSLTLTIGINRDALGDR